MKKIVFFDIDGTLLDREKNLPASAKEAIYTLQKNGIYTAIATGRAPFMITSLLEELKMDSYVTYNGQYVVSGQEVVYKNPLSSEGLEKLEYEAGKKNHPLVYMNESTLKTSVKNDQRVAAGLGSLKMSQPAFDPEFYQKKEIYQTLLFAKETEETYFDLLEDFTFIRWHENALDVVPKGGSKAEGIKKLITHLGFEMENVYAFGDGLNDIEMLETVGKGIAMGNALDVVKSSADYVTTDVEDNGIVNGLKAMGLIPASFHTIPN